MLEDLGSILSLRAGGVGREATKEDERGEGTGEERRGGKMLLERNFHQRVNHIDHRIYPSPEAVWGHQVSRLTRRI